MNKVLTLLVAEDEAAIRDNLVRLLRMEGHAVLVAEDGAQALALAREHLPDLVLSDINMPNLDGFGLLDRLRLDPRTAPIPLIFLSARSERADVRRGMALGADDYLVKPFSREEVLEAVAARLERSRMLTNPAATSAEPEIATRVGYSIAGPAAAARPAEPPSPVRVKGFEMLRNIGRGGMSEVYLARREADGQMVALKLLDTRINQDEALLQRFIQEYSLLEGVDHPNVARIYGQGFADEHVFITMEYFPLGDIRRPISGGIAPLAALGVTLQIARALGQIHALGIVHRDVKPENIMRREDGTVALIDFGIAKHAGSELGVTLHGHIVGSPHYMSPEQASAKPVSAASDLYCLGVIFHEMLTGRKPFTGEDIGTLLAAHMFAPVPSLPESVGEYQGLLERLLAKDPASRFGHGEELAAHLLERWPLAAQARL